MPSFKYISIIILLLTSFIRGQKTTDNNDLSCEHEDIIKLLDVGQYNKVNQKSKFVLNKIPKDAYQKRINCFSTIGNSFLRKGLIDSAAYYFGSADEILSFYKSDLLLSNSFENKASIFMKKRMVDSAMVFLLKSLEYAEKSNNVNRIIKSNQNIGQLFIEKREFEKAKKYLNISYNLSVESKLIRFENLSKFQLGRILVEEKKYDDAERSFNEVIQYAEKHKNIELIMIGKANLGRVFLLTDRFDDAMKLNLEVIRLINQVDYAGKNKQLADDSNKFVELYEKDNDSAIMDSAKSMAVQLLKEQTNPEVNLQQRQMLIHAVNSESILTNKEKRILLDTSMIAEIGKTIELQDSLYKNSLEQKYSEYEEKYDSERQQKENEKLTKVNIKQKEENKITNIQKWIFAVIAGLFLLLSFLFWKRFYKEKKLKKKLAEQYAYNENLHRELHHRMKNNLTVIDTFILLAKNKFDNSEYQDKLTELQNRIKSMFQIHEQLFDKKNIEEVNAREYTNALSNLVIKAYNNNSEIFFENTTDEKEILTSTTALAISFIINEFITNSFKHAFPENKYGKISLNLTSDEKQVFLTLEDNGVGIPMDLPLENSDSFGLETIKNIIEQYKGSFKIWSDNGTRMKIQMAKQ